MRIPVVLTGGTTLLHSCRQNVSGSLEAATASGISIRLGSDSEAGNQQKKVFIRSPLFTKCHFIKTLPCFIYRAALICPSQSVPRVSRLPINVCFGRRGNQRQRWDFGLGEGEGGGVAVVVWGAPLIKDACRLLLVHWNHMIC